LSGIEVDSENMRRVVCARALKRKKTKNKSKVLVGWWSFVPMYHFGKL